MDPLDSRDMDKTSWRRAEVLVPCLVVAAAIVSIASVYLMPARVLAGLPTFVPRFGRTLGMKELGGSRVVLEVASTEAGAVEKTMAIARGRVKALGVREARVSQIGANRILVETPGYDDMAKLAAMVGRNGRLTFQMIDVDPELGGALRDYVPPGEDRLLNVSGPYPATYVVKKDPIVTGAMMKDAEFTLVDGYPAVGFRLDEAGTHRLAVATTVNVGRQFAIVLDTHVITAPRINAPITGGRSVITGRFTAESAQELAIMLRSGPLPGTVSVVEEERVGPGA